MKEKDYTDATNLAKLRIADFALRTVITLKHEEVTLHLGTAVAAVRWLVEHYENEIERKSP